MTIMDSISLQSSRIEQEIRSRFEDFSDDEIELSAAPNDLTYMRAAQLVAYCEANEIKSSYAFGYDGSIGVCVDWAGGLDYFDLLCDGRIRYYSRNEHKEAAIVEANNAANFLYEKTYKPFSAYVANYAQNTVFFSVSESASDVNILLVLSH